MNRRIATIGSCLLALMLGAAPAVSAQPRALSEAECQVLRERLADHARLSEGVRRALGTHVAAAPPAAAPAPAPSAAAPATSRADAIRARLAELPRDRKPLEEQRLAARVRLDWSRASELQAKIQALDTEKAALERELVALPAAATAPAPAARPAGPIRVVAQMGDFERAHARLLAGELRTRPGSMGRWSGTSSPATTGASRCG